MAESVTSICNQALGKLGSLRINDFDDTTESSTQAIQCRLHYEPTRDALLRSYFWRFARDRKVLSQDTIDPVFEWDNQFILPNDFIRFRSFDEDTGAASRNKRHALEGDRLLTNFSSISLRYIKKVTNVAKFDPLFVKLLVWLLADEMIGPLTGGDARIQKKIDRAIEKLTIKAPAVDEDETDTGGRSDWNLARHGGLGITGTPERLL